MHTQKVGSPRATESPRRLPDNGAAPLSPRTAMPRVLKKEYEALLLSVGKSDSLCQPVFDIDSFITVMSSAIAKECARAGLPAKAEGMQETAAQIGNALGQVDTCYEKCDFATCHTYVTAAKGNQVVLLASIDALKQDPDGDQGFSEAHHQCVQLGYKIAALSQLVNDKLSQQQQQQQQQQQPRSPRPSSPRFVSSPEKQKNQKAKRADAAPTRSPHERRVPCSPERGTGNGPLEKLPSPSSGKRLQGDEDSPQLKNSPAKRHKAQMAEQLASPASQAENETTINASGPTEAMSRMKTSSPTKLPKLDWSSAKPVSAGPHSPLSTTPRTQKPTQAERKGEGKQNADNGVPTSSTPAHDARTEANGDGDPSSVPTSPSSVRLQANLDSPRKILFSPSKPLKAQPRPRPPSMLFSSPPGTSGPADLNDMLVEKGGDDSDLTTLQAPPSTPISTSTITTTSTPGMRQRMHGQADV